MRRLSRFRALASGERRVALLAWLLLPIVDIALRLTSMVRVRRGLGRLTGCLPLGPTSDARATAAADHLLVAAAARHHLWPMTCLRRTLVLEVLLVAQGVHAELHFGARRDGEGLEAHCWLELDGEPVGETPEMLVQYAALRPVAGEQFRT